MKKTTLQLVVCIGFFVSSLSAVDWTDWIENDWVEDPSDPIYTPYLVGTLPDDYFPCVIFNQDQFDGHGDGVFYKMWHQGPEGIALSNSNDGVNWTLIGEVVLDPAIFPSVPLHASVVYDKNGFGGSGYFYKMWYWTGSIGFFPPTLGIKFTQSVDGITWTTPVDTTQDTTQFLADSSMGGISPFYQFYGFGAVIYNPSATSIPGLPYTFPYVAFFDSSAAEIFPQTTEEAVGLAYSDDGIFWTRFGAEPVLLPSGSSADWDGKYSYRASVFYLNGLYHMYYSGSSEINNPNPAFSYTFGIGHAISEDGINWIRDPSNPIFTINDVGETWRDGRTLASSVVKGPDGLFQMWFSGGQNIGSNFLTAAIGYATMEQLPPSLPGGSAGITSNSKNAPISITTGGGGSCILNAGNQTNSYAAIATLDSSISINISGDILINGTIKNNALNANATVQAGQDIEMNGNRIELVAGAAQNSNASILSGHNGEINLNATTMLILTGGDSAVGSSQANIVSLGGDITLNSGEVVLTGGTGINSSINIISGTSFGQGNVFIQGSEITATGHNVLFEDGSINIHSGLAKGGSIILTSTSGPIELTECSLKAKASGIAASLVINSADDLILTDTEIITLSADVSMNSSGSIVLNQSTVQVNVNPMGTFQAIANDNIVFDSNSSVLVSGSNPLVLFVVDNANPMTVGSGSFQYPIGAQIKTFHGSGFVRIYSSAQMTNMVQTGANINGINYVPGVPGVDTPHEVWNNYFNITPVPPPPEDGSDSYTIYYKSPNM